MKYEVVGERLYLSHCTILRSEDTIISTFLYFYEVTPVKAGAFVTVKDNEQFYAFVFSGTEWVTE